MKKVWRNCLPYGDSQPPAVLYFTVGLTLSVSKLREY